LLIIILLVSEFKGNPFFCQERPGKNGRLFRLVKFRTMDNKTDSEGILLPDKSRITKIGRVLRSASLDELPQLINIVTGRMSFIGPRPLLPGYLSLYNDFQSRRHEVKPGITGWAQVNGRNQISWDEKFSLDVWYVDNVTFRLDLLIMFKTIRRVITMKGINSSSNYTMQSFRGNN